MCCWLQLDDTLPQSGDEGLLPYASIMIRDTFTPKPKGPCSVAARCLTIHIDPMLADRPVYPKNDTFRPQRSFPALEFGYTTWSIDGTEMSHKDRGRFFMHLEANLYDIAARVTYARYLHGKQDVYEIKLRYQRPLLYDDRVFEFQEYFEDTIDGIRRSIMCDYGLENVIKEIELNGEDPSSYDAEMLWTITLPEVRFEYELVDQLDKCGTCEYQPRQKLPYWEEEGFEGWDM